MSENPPGQAAKLIRKLAIELSIMTLIGIVLALIGPFGSAADPLAIRLVSWIAFCWVGYAIYGPMRFVVGAMERKLHLPRGPLWVAVTLLATAPMTAAVLLMQTRATDFSMPSVQDAFEAYFNVLVIGGSITVLFQLIARGDKNGAREVSPADDAAAADETPAHAAPASSARPNDALGVDVSQPRFLARIPAELGTQLIALEMEDHYVRAHTALGSDLVLMRMRDAVAELDDLDGMQVHRSWWVARGAVSDVHRDGRNIRLVLGGGLEAPVSRANVSVLKEMGWI